MRERKIVITDAFTRWIMGTIDGMEFEAKVYDDGSEYGIDDGRVVKLFVHRDNPYREYIAYERGWVKYPSKRYEDYLDSLLLLCEMLPPSESWKVINGRIVDKRGDPI